MQPSTVEVVYRHLASIFKSAVADRIIAVSPCDRISLPKIDRKRVVPLETDTVLAIADARPERYRALVVLAAGTGLRQGEAFGLTVPNVDFLRRRLDVVQQLLLIQNRPPVLAPPKTDASVRSIPLPQSVADALARHLERFPPNDNQLVFTNERGEPISRTRFSDPWRKAVKAANAPAGTGFHSLRHYYASLLIRHGESVKVVQARLGHASAAETLDTYSHLWPDSEDQTREAVDAVLDISRPNRGPRSVLIHVSAGQDRWGTESACTPDTVEGCCGARPADRKCCADLRFRRWLALGRVGRFRRFRGLFADRGLPSPSRIASCRLTRAVEIRSASYCAGV
jgi:integrase